MDFLKTDIGIFKIIAAFFGCVFTYLFGCVDQLIIALITFVLIDFITGVLCAIYNKNLSSSTAWLGIAKKVGTFLIVAIAVIIDKNVGMDGALRTLVIWFYIATEGISIIENWGKLGLPLPKKLLVILEQLKSKSEEEHNIVEGDK